jgi:2-(1,2-epoxy-1,2-dihydrophenyl)acetyl-CoA isomerase
MDEVLLETNTHGLRTLAMNRPDRRNALDATLCERLLQATVAAAADNSVRALLLRGEGHSFCVGGDVKSMAEGEGRTLTVEQRVQGLRRCMEASRQLHTMPKPVVAAIRGAAAGAGLSLALACDFRIAARSAKFTTAFARVGLSGDFGGSWFLSKMVGSAKARELYLKPRVLTADEAFSLGLLTQVVADDELEAAALEFAKDLASGPTVTLSYIKQNLNQAETGSLESTLDMEAMHHIRCSMTDDHREAAAAFVEKRSPVFNGR